MKHIAIAVVVSVLVLVASGCVTSRAPSTFPVSVLANGRVSVRGRMVAMEDMGKRLKAVGALPSTTIEVEIAREIPRAEMMRITGLLRRDGYVRVLFKRPRRAEVLKQ